MALKTLIDGYNLIWAFPELRRLMQGRASDLARAGLLELLARIMAAGRLRPPVTVIFDGRAGSPIRGAESLERSRNAGIEVRFAPHPANADDLIVELTASRAVSDELVVVTSDRALQSRVRRHGAAVISVREFVAECVPAAKSREVLPSEEDLAALEKPGGPLSKEAVQRWLDEFGIEDGD